MCVFVSSLFQERNHESLVQIRSGGRIQDPFLSIFFNIATEVGPSTSVTEAGGCRRSGSGPMPCSGRCPAGSLVQTSGKLLLSQGRQLPATASLPQSLVVGQKESEELVEPFEFL